APNALALEAGAEGEGQLDAPGAGAHDYELDARPATRALDDGVGRAHEGPDGPRGDRVLGDAGPVQARDGRADVEGDRVIGERRPAFEDDPALRGIEPRGRGHDDARPRPHAERPHVDLELVLTIRAR